MKSLLMIMKLCLADGSSCKEVEHTTFTPYDVNSCLVAASVVLPKMNDAELFKPWRIKSFACYVGRSFPA